MSPGRFSLFVHLLDFQDPGQRGERKNARPGSGVPDVLGGGMDLVENRDVGAPNPMFIFESTPKYSCANSRQGESGGGTVSRLCRDQGGWASRQILFTYLKELNWNQNDLVFGKNGIAALTFCDVPILPEKPRSK